MSIGSGIGGSVGIAAESEYGTFVAPTRFHDVTKTDMKKVKTTVQGGGLANGRMAQPGKSRAVTSVGGAGTIDLEVPNQGFGLLLSQIFGDAPTPALVGGSSVAYSSTFAMKDNVGKSFTLQQNVPQTDGTLQTYSFLGTKVTDVEFQCTRDALLTVTLTLDSQDVSEADAMAAPSYISGVMPFTFKQLAVTMGTYGSETAIDGISTIDLKFTRSQDTSRFYAGSNGLKAEPLMNGWAAVSGSLDADFVDKTQLADVFRDDTAQSLVLSFTGALLDGTVHSELSFNVPMVFLDGDSPVIDGPAIVTGSYPFTAQYDGSHPLISATYVSKDVTL